MGKGKAPEWGYVKKEEEKAMPPEILTMSTSWIFQKQYGFKYSIPWGFQNMVIVKIKSSLKILCECTLLERQ